MKRVLLALVPVALIATASQALPGVAPESQQPLTSVSQLAASLPTSPSTAPTGSAAIVAQRTSGSAGAVAQASGAQAGSSQVAQQPPAAPAPVLPELVVDKSALVEAMASLVRAHEQAQLAVTALDADAQRLHIQETINLLAGAGDAHFRVVGQAGASVGTYPGAIPLVTQGLQARETAEAAWLAEVDRISGGEVAGAGGAPAAPPAMTTLGTRGMRPEEQAGQLMGRALTQAVEALAAAEAKAQRFVFGEEIAERIASDEATAIMESVVRLLDSALKIVQIAIDR